MTPELFSLLGFAAWAIVLVLALATWRAALVVAGRKQANEFPSGQPHGTERYWRLNRAHINTLENLPIFGSIILVAHLAGVHTPLTAALAQTVLGARVVQSLVHIASGSAMAVVVRFTAFAVQLGCWAGLLWAIVAA